MAPLPVFLLATRRQSMQPFMPNFGNDFWAWVPMLRQIHTAAFLTTGPYPFLYPPGAAPFEWLFAILPHPTLFFYAACLAAVLAGCTALVLALVRRGADRVRTSLGVALLALTSYPLLWCLSRGNIELLIAAFATLGVVLLYADRPKAGAVCIGLILAAKIYPVFLLGLFFAEKKWKAIAIALGIALLSTVASLWLINPSLPTAIAETRIGLHKADELVVFTAHGVIAEGFDHSLLGVYKRFARSIPPPDQFAPVVGRYVLVMLGLSLLLFFTRLLKMPRENQVFGVVILMITFTPLSFDYTLLHLYLPMALLALALQRGAASSSAHLPFFFALCALAIAPLSEFVHHDRQVGLLFRALALLTMLAMVCWKPLVLDPRQNRIADRVTT